MSFCYVCGKELTEENQSDEHILLNALGGHLTSKKLLCKTCNSKFGENSDAKLARQLNFFATMLMIKRDCGEPQPVIMNKQSTGQKYRVGVDGKPQMKDPIVTQIRNNDKLSFNIQAPNIKEAKKILKGFAKKNKTINVDDSLSKAQHIEEQFEEPLSVNLVLGGKEALPSILKTAINYYVELTQNSTQLKKVISELKTGNTQSVEPIIMERRIFELAEKEVSHSIYLYGKNGKKLYAVVEYFNVVTFLVKLSDNYFGDDIESLYVFDVLNRDRINKRVIFRMPFDFIFTYTYPKSKPNFKIMQDAISRVMHVARMRQDTRKREEIMDKAWRKTIGQIIPEGELVTQEAGEKFIQQLLMDLRPYLIQVLKK